MLDKHGFTRQGNVVKCEIVPVNNASRIHRDEHQFAHDRAQALRCA